MAYIINIFVSKLSPPLWSVYFVQLKQFMTLKNYKLLAFYKPNFTPQFEVQIKTLIILVLTKVHQYAR